MKQKNYGCIVRHRNLCAKYMSIIERETFVCTSVSISYSTLWRLFPSYGRSCTLQRFNVTSGVNLSSHDFYHLHEVPTKANVSSVCLCAVVKVCVMTH